MKRLVLTKPDIDWLIDSMKRVFPTREESTEKYNNVMEKLDTFVGEIQKKREAQELHAGQHRTINNRFERIDKLIGISTV